MAALYRLDFGTTMETFAVALALGDAVLGLGCLFGLPRAVGRSHWELLTDAPHRQRQILGAARI
jgi:hypothetical protein